MDEALLMEDPRSIELRRNLGYLRFEYGAFHERRKDFTAALEQYLLALDLFQTISSADPKNADARLGVAIAHHNIGEVRRQTNELETALQEFSEARRAYEPIVAADPGNTWAAGMLAQLYFNMGDVHERIGKSVAPAARQERLGRACALYALASERYGRLKAAGMLQPFKGDTSEQMAQALARCRGGSRD